MLAEIDLINYSKLLLDYCLEIKPGSRLFIQSTTLAEPLIIQLYKGTLERQAIAEVNFSLDGQENIFNSSAHLDALNWVNPTYIKAVNEFDAYLYIRAPHLPSSFIPMNTEKAEIRRQALLPYQRIYNHRTGNRSLRRSLCQYPTPASALDAEMALDRYENFVLESCFLRANDPLSSWNQLSVNQQKIVNYLNNADLIRYINSKSDISFSTKGRTWINSDGRTNMPSGEVYSSPIEDSVNGHIFFDYPFLYQQQVISGVYLEVKEGKVVHASAEEGYALLKEMLTIPGADHFGEVAIGTNPNIQIPTKNILFDEKMSGTVHMALGQSYLQCGGKNESALHQDMICNMKDGGEIWADGILIYSDGNFLI